MALLPDSLQSLVNEFGRLPGVGEKTALRYAISLLRAGPNKLQDMIRALDQLGKEVAHCPTCFFWTHEELCPLCNDQNRSKKRLCVVRDCPDVLAIERFRKQDFSYHVLQGVLSPLSGVGPSQLRLKELFNRVAKNEVGELILALDPTIEGDATSLFIRDHVSEDFPDLLVTRTALGLPAGSSVEYLDPSTIESALTHRTPLE